MKIAAIFAVSVFGFALAGCEEDPVAPVCQQIQIPALAGDTVQTSSGLKYLVRTEGTGDTAMAGQRVAVQYAGYLPDGTLFDSTGNGPAVTFSLDRVIRGFAEGITGMQVGGSRRLFIPPALGYGADSPSPCIPANSTLIFDVELFGVAGS